MGSIVVSGKHDARRPTGQVSIQVPNGGRWLLVVGASVLQRHTATRESPGERRAAGSHHSSLETFLLKPQT